MFELLMLLFLPTDVNPEKLGMKYILQDRFINYESCEEYVQKNLYTKKNEEVSIFYKVDTKEYQVILTYCKPVKEDE